MEAGVVGGEVGREIETVEAQQVEAMLRLGVAAGGGMPERLDIAGLDVEEVVLGYGAGRRKQERRKRERGGAAAAYETIKR